MESKTLPSEDFKAGKSKFMSLQISITLIDFTLERLIIQSLLNEPFGLNIHSIKLGYHCYFLFVKISCGQGARSVFEFLLSISSLF